MTRNGPLTVVLLFGGTSSEHEVSRVSATTFADNMAPEKYNLIKIGIAKDGRWLQTNASSDEMRDGSWEHLAGNLPCVVSPDRALHGLIRTLPDGRTETQRVDVVIPALHGLYGEDGTVQGLFKLAGIPFVGCGVLASAVCMDKGVANALFEAAGVPHCRWSAYTRYELQRDPEGCRAALEEKLGYPMFVKPANAGSSVGVTCAHNAGELAESIRIAMHEDNKIVFEEAVVGQEVECAVIGSNPPHSTRPGEILAGDVFYTYDDKYKNGVSRTLMTANLSEEKLDEVKHYAEKAYAALGCEGLSRCDFFVEKATGRVLINEINTFPGFTPISMYPKLMEHEGVGITALIDRLIELALLRGEQEAMHG